MAKVTFNSRIDQVWGKIDRLVLRRSSHPGVSIMSAAPDMSKVKWSEAQKAHRQRFRQAVAYARAAMADARVRAQYEKDAAQKGKRPFDMAVSDYFKGRDLLNEGT